MITDIHVVRSHGVNFPVDPSKQPADLQAVIVYPDNHQDNNSDMNVGLLTRFCLEYSVSYLPSRVA